MHIIKQPLLVTKFLFITFLCMCVYFGYPSPTKKVKLWSIIGLVKEYKWIYKIWNFHISSLGEISKDAYGCRSDPQPFCPSRTPFLHHLSYPSQIIFLLKIIYETALHNKHRNPAYTDVQFLKFFHPSITKPKKKGTA